MGERFHIATLGDGRIALRTGDPDVLSLATLDAGRIDITSLVAGRMPLATLDAARIDITSLVSTEVAPPVVANAIVTNTGDTWVTNTGDIIIWGP